MKKGQALLVAILVIFTAALALGLAAATVALVQNQSSANQRLADQTYNMAQAGVENALMRISRGETANPQTLSDGTTSCTINISGSDPSYQILAIAESPAPLSGTKKVTKKIQADVSIVGGVTTIISYQEIN